MSVCRNIVLEWSHISWACVSTYAASGTKHTACPPWGRCSGNATIQTGTALALQVGSSRLGIWCSVGYAVSSLTCRFPQYDAISWAHLPPNTWPLISQMSISEFIVQCCEHDICLTLAFMICKHGLDVQTLAGIVLSPAWVCPCQSVSPHQAPRSSISRSPQDLLFGLMSIFKPKYSTSRGGGRNSKTSI